MIVKDSAYVEKGTQSVIPINSSCKVGLFSLRNYLTDQTNQNPCYILKNIIWQETFTRKPLSIDYTYYQKTV